MRCGDDADGLADPEGRPAEKSREPRARWASVTLQRERRFLSRHLGHLSSRTHLLDAQHAQRPIEYVYDHSLSRNSTIIRETVLKIDGDD